jgi:hypothetical protein
VAVYAGRGDDHPGVAVDDFCTGVLRTLAIRVFRVLRDIVLSLVARGRRD